MLNGQIENHIIVDEIPPSLKAKPLDRGCSGVAYLTSDNKVFKEFKSLYFIEGHIIDCEYIYDEDFYSEKEYYRNLKELTTVKSPSFAFPETIVYKHERKDENIVGYLMKPLFCKNMKYIDPNIGIDELINYIEKFELELYDLATRYGITVKDLHTDNVRFKEGYGFVAYDTDTYDCYSLEDSHILFSKNIKEWGNLVVLIYASGFPFINEELNYIHNKCIFYGKARPSVLMKMMLEEMRKNCDDIKTFADFKEGIELIRKKDVILNRKLK